MNCCIRGCPKTKKSSTHNCWMNWGMCGTHAREIVRFYRDVKKRM